MPESKKNQEERQKQIERQYEAHQEAYRRLPEILKDLRLSEKLTQKQLAKETGLSLSAIVSYENGLREPNSKAMAVLERYFNVSGPFLRGELKKETFYKVHEDVKKDSNEWAKAAERYIVKHTKLLADLEENLGISPQDRQQDAFRFITLAYDYATDNILSEPDSIDESYIKPDDFSALLCLMDELSSTGITELLKRTYELSLLPTYRKKLSDVDNE